MGRTLRPGQKLVRTDDGWDVIETDSGFTLTNPQTGATKRYGNTLLPEPALRVRKPIANRPLRRPTTRKPAVRGFNRRKTSQGGLKYMLGAAALMTTLGAGWLGITSWQNFTSDKHEAETVETRTLPGQVPDGNYLSAGSFSDFANAELVVSSLESVLEARDCDSCGVFTEDIVHKGKIFRRVLLSYNDDNLEEMRKLASRSTKADLILKKLEGSDNYERLEERLREQVEMLSRTRSDSEYVRAFREYRNMVYAEIDSQTELRGRERELFHDIMYVVTRTESSFDPRAIGSAGEIGLTQIKPATARGIDRNRKEPQQADSTYRRILKNPATHYEYAVWLMNDAREYWAKKLDKPWTHEDVIRMMLADHNQGRGRAGNYHSTPSARGYVEKNFGGLEAMQSPMD